jgi:hypothetical protein
VPINVQTKEESDMDWRSIDTAPRDGTVVEVMADGFGPYEMMWNREGFNFLVSSEFGIWEHTTGGFTWSEEYGGGPTHWRAISRARLDALQRPSGVI